MLAVKKPGAIKKLDSQSKSTDQSKQVVSGQLKKKINKAKSPSKQRKERGVVLVKHLPHGFFEQQLRQYFNQFGNVTRVRLGRSERTGGSKGFAFIEFEYPEVAKVAADTMDNYLMFKKLVKAIYIPPEKQSFNFFRTSVKKVKNKAGKEIYVSDLTRATQNSVKNQNNWSETACQKRTKAASKKLKELQKKYKHLGIDMTKFVVQPEKKLKEIPQKSEKKAKVQKTELELADLLGNTINDDSADEDYVATSDTDSDEQGLDSAEDTDDIDGEDDEEEEEVKPPVSILKEKKKNTAGDHLDKLTSRKRGTGAVQKKKKPVTTAKLPKNEASRKLKLTAAKQLANQLPNKIGKKLKK